MGDQVFIECTSCHREFTCDDGISADTTVPCPLCGAACVSFTYPDIVNEE